MFVHEIEIDVAKYYVELKIRLNGVRLRDVCLRHLRFSLAEV